MSSTAMKTLMGGTTASWTMRSGGDVYGRRVYLRRMHIVLGALAFCLLIIIARLIEVQLIRGVDYEAIARSQHYGGITLPAKRGEILSRNSKTGELNILATNTTLDLLYVDPFVTPDKRILSKVLADTLLTENQHTACMHGDEICYREFRTYYASAFKPQQLTEEVIEIPGSIPIPIPSVSTGALSDVRQQFAIDIERRINEEFVSFVPLLYGATKVQLRSIQDFAIPGIYASSEQKTIYANPLHIPNYERRRVADILSPVIGVETDAIERKLLKRRLRYVPILRRVSPDISKTIKQLKVESLQTATQERQRLLREGSKKAAEEVQDVLRGVALIPEHWRYYPDSTVASQIVGFVNSLQEAQGGIERTLDRELRGLDGEINTLIDPFGGQIVSDNQTVRQAQDGKTIVLTIDRFLQKQVEDILSRAVTEYQADSGQVVIIDPFTGKLIVMANAPVFDANNYSTVYAKEYIDIPPEKIPHIVVEVYHPVTSKLIIRSYLNDLTTEGRTQLSSDLRVSLDELEKFYDLDSLKRYYLYIGENSRREVFPDGNNKWLKYKNEIGVGAYVNRIVQEICEPGSVFKSFTMAIAIDQGEISPEDTYNDTGPVEIDEFRIDNAEGKHFGLRTMTDCIAFSINTCLTSVSLKLGKKLFSSYIERFGFGRITGIEFEGEKAGDILHWKRWSDALLATASYGQGITTTPLQMIVAYCSLANGGKLIKPTLIDSVIYPDGRIEESQPQILEQVITPEAAATITAMLTYSVNVGYAKPAKVPGYRIAGKTGTSQIAGPGGKYEKYGSGSTIATFAGYAPVDHPKFVMLVKLDRPRVEMYGTRSAVPVFREIAAILFKYYGIPPDEPLK